MKEIPEIKVNQRWIREATGITFRVMALAEGYIMARAKGGCPIVISANELHKKYTLNPQSIK